MQFREEINDLLVSILISFMKVEGLSKTGFPVLWSLEDKLQKMLPELNQYIKSSFKVESDVPQHAVLKHPNVKGFLSNCGSSALESLYLQFNYFYCT